MCYHYRMYINKINEDLKRVIKELGFITPTDAVLSISENPRFGDYTSNIALQLSKQEHKKSYQSPVDIASAIISKIGHPQYIERIEVAGPGFINFYLKEDSLVEILKNPLSAKPKTDQSDHYLVEYGDQNTHKMLHIGHLIPLTLGECMCRLLEFQGAKVYRVNYGSDIGLTVGKSLWGISQLEAEFEAAEKSTLRAKAQFLGKSYAWAHKFYTEDPNAKAEIDALTKKIYARDESIKSLWEKTTEWSLAYFDSVYTVLGTEFDRRVNESEVDEIGKRIVLENLEKVFMKDGEAIIFPGEKYGLHNRVFITSTGNPTYEAKDVGLTELYLGINQFERIYSFAHREQNDYFKVVLKAIELVFGDEGKKRKHMSFGELRLPSGKMGSRSGNIIAAEEMIDVVKAQIREKSPGLSENSVTKLAVGAIKFWFFKYSTNSDIVYDIEESVSLQGDTGPYVMYVYARINSLLNRAKGSEAKTTKVQVGDEGIAQSESELSGSADQRVGDIVLEDEERMVLRQLEFFETIVQQATKDFQPSILAGYLLQLSKLYNVFYEKCPIIGSEKKDLRLKISKQVGETVHIGLYLLGIETVDKM